MEKKYDLNHIHNWTEQKKVFRILFIPCRVYEKLVSAQQKTQLMLFLQDLLTEYVHFAEQLGLPHTADLCEHI